MGELPQQKVRRTSLSGKRPGRHCSKPPEFSGSDNPVDCMKWIREIEHAFRLNGCGKESKVTYPSHMLRGNTLQWCNITANNQNKIMMTRSCRPPSRKRLLTGRFEEEFRGFNKGNMLVREYLQLFLENLNLIGHVVLIVKEKIIVYLKGLPTDMLSMVRNAKASTLMRQLKKPR
ncbi:LOW QUALITY PROTEIN: hypothetical protein OSB04_000864 [Centaurea solstitialis]|uniref:Retrotransposon gag domain-containing protein n=1 Tax=Centaurea solstitialis TaxID=347529 RepID=A0AA38TPX5_9ASTR|nr:LOW QUALITY PROTEIN: hypothetical protein OSB04_000864 [Centaurea solstitialis]